MKDGEDHVAEVAAANARADAAERALADARARPFEFLHGLGYRLGNGATVGIGARAPAQHLRSVVLEIEQVHRRIAERDVALAQELVDLHSELLSAIAVDRARIPVDKELPDLPEKPVGCWVLVRNVSPPPHPKGHVELPTDVLYGMVEAAGSGVDQASGIVGQHVNFQRSSAIEIVRRVPTMAGRGEPDLYVVHFNNILAVVPKRSSGR
jgi:hypothetical protein